MLVSHLFVVPTDDTVEYFRRQLSGCPFLVKPEEFRVTIALSLDALEPDPDSIYLAKSGNMGLYPASPTGGTSLILPLLTPSMHHENARIYQEARPAYPRTMYSPHIVVVQHMPPLKRYIKSWVNSLSGIFRNEQGYLTFGNETVESIELKDQPGGMYLEEQTFIHQQMMRQAT